MDGPSDHPLAGTGLSPDEHVRAARRELTDPLVDLDHLRAPAHERVEPVVLGRSFRRAAGELARVPVPKEPGENGRQLGLLEWLHEEVERPFTHGTRDRCHVLMCRHDHDVDLGRTLAKRAEQLDAVHARHAHVGEHDIG